VAKLKTQETNERMLEGVMKSTEQAAACVQGYGTGDWIQGKADKAQSSDF